MSRVLIRVPTPLRSFTNGADEVAVEAATVSDALARLGERHPGILERVLDRTGAPRQFVNLFLGSQDVRALQGMATPLAEGAVLAIVPAVAGGAYESQGRPSEGTQAAHPRA